MPERDGPARAAPKAAPAWRIGSVAGIPIRIHWLMLLALPFFAYLMADHFTRAGRLTGTSLLWGALLAVILFASVTVHELAHSLMAKRFGVRVRSITLLPIGGVSQMESIPREPRREFLVSVVGPLTNFVLAAPLLAAAAWAPLPAAPDLEAFLRWAGLTNLSLGVFNLFFPAFPMDGGRILRSLLARRMGYARATSAAALVGRVLAVLVGLVGAFTPGGIFLVLIAFFIYAGAGEEARIVGIEEALGDLRLGQLMTRQPAFVTVSDSVEAVLQRMLETKHVGFPVAGPDGNPVGYVGLAELGRVDARQRGAVRASQVMRDPPPVVAADALAKEALHTLGAGHDALLVSEAGRIAGIVTRTDLARAVAILGLRADH